MKRAGILTFHFADNYGAVLQCYALRRVINSLSDCKAEIINYIPPGYTCRKIWRNRYEEKLFERKREKFKSFLREQCGVDLDGRIIRKVMDGEKYDYYIAGSDQIWNTGAGREEYFLPHIPEKAKRIAYAASVGRSADSPRLRSSVLKKGAAVFDFLSTREQEHADLIQKLTGRECACVLDPALLLEEKHYLPLIAEDSLRDRPYIFLFMLNNDGNTMRGVTLANDLSRRLDLEVVHSLHAAPDHMIYSDGGCMQFEGIDSFLWYVRNAEYIVTNSYHATIFSILFRKPFYLLGTETMNSRVDTLKQKLHIEDRVVNGYIPMNRLTPAIDYGKIYDCLDKERKASMYYLKRSLDIGQNPSEEEIGMTGSVKRRGNEVNHE